MVPTSYEFAFCNYNQYNGNSVLNATEFQPILTAVSGCLEWRKTTSSIITKVGVF